MQTEHVVPQEHPMGCAVSCVASLFEMRYEEALQLFQCPENAWTRGFFCSEVVSALSTISSRWSFEEFDPVKHLQTILKSGTIVFIEANSKYPMGHYLLRTQSGWMNPWINFPQMIPVESAIEKSLPGKISYVIFQKE